MLHHTGDVNGEIQQLILSGVEIFLPLDVHANLVRTGIRLRVLEPHYIEQIAVLIAVAFSADDTPCVELEVRDKPVVIERFTVRTKTVFVTSVPICSIAFR